VPVARQIHAHTTAVLTSQTPKPWHCFDQRRLWYCRLAATASSLETGHKQVVAIPTLGVVLLRPVSVNCSDNAGYIED
jgi:hypothetical protein